MVDDISHEGLRVLLREEGVIFQCLNPSWIKLVRTYVVVNEVEVRMKDV